MVLVYGGGMVRGARLCRIRLPVYMSGSTPVGVKQQWQKTPNGERILMLIA